MRARGVWSESYHRQLTLMRRRLQERQARPQRIYARCNLTSWDVRDVWSASIKQAKVLGDANTWPILERQSFRHRRVGCAPNPGPSVWLDGPCWKGWTMVEVTISHHGTWSRINVASPRIKCEYLESFVANKSSFSTCTFIRSSGCVPNITTVVILLVSFKGQAIPSGAAFHFKDVA